MVTLPITIIAIWRGMDAKDTKTIAVATRRIKIHYHLRSSTHSLRVKSRPCSNISRALIFFMVPVFIVKLFLRVLRTTGSRKLWRP